MHCAAIFHTFQSCSWMHGSITSIVMAAVWRKNRGQRSWMVVWQENAFSLATTWFYFTFFQQKGELWTGPGCMEDCGANACWTLGPLLLINRKCAGLKSIHYRKKTPTCFKSLLYLSFMNNFDWKIEFFSLGYLLTPEKIKNMRYSGETSCTWS